MERVARLAQRLLLGDERAIARAVQAGILTPEERARGAFEEAFAFRPGWIRIGQTVRGERGYGPIIGLPPDVVHSRHAWMSGASGAGKSVASLAVATQLLERGDCVLIVVDPKGETAAHLRESVLPALVHFGCGAQFEPIRILRPFDPEWTAPLRLTAREFDVPIEVQALAMAQSLAEATGAELGRRMEFCLTALATLAIERNEPLTSIAAWLAAPRSVAHLARDSESAIVRGYLAGDFARENPETLRALRSRLGLTLFLPSVREALEAPTCLSFEDCFASGVTVIDLSAAPALDTAARLLGSTILGRLLRAALNRHLGDDARPVVLLIDEVQEITRHAESVNLARVLALVRHRKVHIHLVNQAPSQLGVDLVRALRTNVAVECVFRSSEADAEALAPGFAVDADTPHPAEARGALVRQITRLPRRHCFLWVKESMVSGQLVRIVRFDLERLQRLGGELPAAVRARVVNGSLALRRSSQTVAWPKPAVAPDVQPDVDGRAESGPFPNLG